MKRVSQNESLVNKYNKFTCLHVVYMLRAFVTILAGFSLKYYELVLSVQNIFISNIPMPPGPGNLVEPSNFMV